jgi:hypothetical protein
VSADRPNRSCCASVRRHTHKIHTHTHTYTHAYIHTHIYRDTDTYICTHLHTHTHTHVYRNTQIYTYIYRRYICREHFHAQSIFKSIFTHKIHLTFVFLLIAGFLCTRRGSWRCCWFFFRCWSVLYIMSFLVCVENIRLDYTPPRDILFVLYTHTFSHTAPAMFNAHTHTHSHTHTHTHTHAHTHHTPSTWPGCGVDSGSIILIPCPRCGPGSGSPAARPSPPASPRSCPPPVSTPTVCFTPHATSFPRATPQPPSLFVDGKSPRPRPHPGASARRRP